MGHDLSVGLVYALHGFLGEGSDWNAVKTISKKWITPSYFSPAAQEFSFAEIKSQPGKKIFIGYSLGGRIGLSILQNDPSLFDHYVLISVNPGFADSDTEAREARWLQDQNWAEKLSAANWENFLQEWNAQNVFSGSNIEPPRLLKNFDLNKLKSSLLERSLAKQPDYRDLIQKNKNKITWVVGLRDEKFVNIAEDLKLRSILDGYFKIESGHRIPFDSPKKLSEIVESINI